MTTQSRSRPSALGLAAFYPLWDQLKEGLTACIPPRVLHYLNPVVGRVVLESDGEGLSAWREEGGDRHSLGSLRGAAADRELLPSGAAHAIVLRLAPAQVLAKELTLPLEAEPDLRRVLSYQMARETPFTAQQVYFDAVVVARDPERRKLRAKLVLSPKAPVEAMLGLLQRSGIQPHAIEAATVPGSNLLPPEQRPRASRSMGRLNLALGGLAGLLLVAAIALPMVEKRMAIKGLNAALADAQQRSEAVVKLRDELDDIEKALGYFSGRQATSGQVLLALNEISRILPDGTWLQMAEFTGNQVRLTGESKDAAALIGLVEASALFADSSFQAPVTRNPTTGSEHFLISARLEGVKGSGEQQP